jgi:hypothetical protein
LKSTFHGSSTCESQPDVVALWILPGSTLIRYLSPYLGRVAQSAPQQAAAKSWTCAGVAGPDLFPFSETRPRDFCFAAARRGADEEDEKAGGVRSHKTSESTLDILLLFATHCVCNNDSSPWSIPYRSAFNIGHHETRPRQPRHP